MDFQIGFNIAMALAGALGGWVVRTLHEEIKEARRDHAALTDHLPGTYARRDDVKGALDRVEGALSRIETKLDRKVDR